MSWINFFFFVIILNTVTGTVAYLLCKLLTRIAEKAGAIRVIYLMYRLVLVFYIVRLDNLVKMIILAITYVDWFNPLLDPYLKEMDKWADISCDISVCNKFLGGKTKLYFDVLINARDPRRNSMPAFVSQLNSKESIERRMNYMIQWKRSGGKKLVSALLMATLIAGSSVTAFAASGQVADQQDNLYREVRITESDTIGAETDQEIQYLPADQVDEEKWENAIVYDDNLDPLTVQKSFTWTVPPDKFVRSTGFIKQKGGQIIVSCYIYSVLNHRVGIRRPDGSQLYVLGTHQITKTFNCESTGTYYVFVENMGRVDIQASGYYIR